MIDIDGFESYLYEEEMSANTIESYIRAVKQYASMFDEVTKQNLIGFKKHLISKYKPQTVNLRLTAMMRYCNYKEISLKIKLIKEPKKTHIDNVMTIEYFNKLVDSLKSDGKYRWYIYILLLGKTGMRISEALKVTKKDLLNGSVTMHTKAHMRTIYFPKSLVEEMMPYLSDINNDDIVMQNINGKPITSRGVAGELQKFAKVYDIPSEIMHPHAFRHFFAIEFLKRNNNIALLADLLGHGSVNVTQIYLRQSQEQQKMAIDNAVNW